MNISTATAGLSIYLPDASKTGTGQTILFNNVGTEMITVRNAGGTQVVTIAAGTLWQVYLTNNSTVNGTWSILQYGSTVSVANASSLAGTGIVAVGALLSQSVPVTAFNSNYTAASTDRAKMFNWTGAGGTLTLPASTTVRDNWFMYLRNSGSGAIVADAPGTTLIDGTSFLSFQPGESAIIACDGTDFYTIGFGKSATFAFDYTVIAVGGTGNYTLTGTELNRVAYRFTGVLTGNRNIIVPATVQQYWVDNQTTGSYTLTVKTPAGLGVIVGQGQRAILYSDGTDVLDADTAGVSYPIAVNQGGTGATTAGAALINLGGTSVGTSLFTAVDQAAAWSALGVAPLGTVNGGSF
jgi:ribosomal protein S5